MREYLQNICFEILKMCMFSYEVLNLLSHAELVGVILVLSLKLMENLQPMFQADQLIRLVALRFCLKEDEIMMKAALVLNHINCFNEKFPYVKNMKEFFSLSHKSK